MAMTRSEMDRKLDEHFGFEAQDNVEGVLATLASDVEHDVVGWPGGPVRGRDATRPVYEALFADLSEGKVRSFMVDDSLWTGKAPGRPFGFEGRDRPLAFRLLHVIEFADSGDIRRENVWVDLGAILQQLPPAA